MDPGLGSTGSLGIGRSTRSIHQADHSACGKPRAENILQARNELSPLVDQLESDLRNSDPGASAVLSGAPIARQATLDAVARALQISLPIAVVLCLIVAAVFMRSIRFALVGIVPILLVVAWLYGFMYVFGYGINLVTATIGAISIGIGIDFAIHFTMRYREELLRHETRIEAIRAAGGGTGVALLASALSSVVGFAILAFAPMPMFASYGLLTAVMIVMAAAGSLGRFAIAVDGRYARPRRNRNRPPRTRNGGGLVRRRAG